MSSSESSTTPPQRSQPGSVGGFESATDVGSVRHAGTCAYDADQDTYIVTGSGANIWGDHDAFHFVWQRMTGNFIATARAAFVGTGVNPHRKLGWMIRPSLDTSAPNVNTGIHGDGLTSLQFRRTQGGPTEEIRFELTAPDVIQLERHNGSYSMSVAHFGEPFVSVELDDLDLGDEVYLGLYVCSHEDEVVEAATFADVRIVVPIKDDFVRYRDHLGSSLEILDVASGRRRVVLDSPDVVEAPNWTTDGAALIYNSGGRLHRFDLAARTSTPIDTGFADRNNNDHVLSFDGTTIALSHHSAEDGNASIVYTVPVTGGTPRRVTATGPSYLHGWSPDGRTLVYTGQRNGQFDIYRIDVDGGEETRLTSTPGLDDGPEYSPDGQFIYFNSTRSGTMQIWRMRPDGSEPEQLTDDEYNNWFPHVAPDGRSIVFLSYIEAVEASDHPPYKRVNMRSMAVDGGTPKVLAYLYGGQGTINVPSWSPDSTQLAFVSNGAYNRTSR